MFVVTGANGQTGSAAMRRLLAGGHRVRAIVRRAEQCAAWREAGAEAVVADLGDSHAMAACFDKSQGAYLMNPPAYAEPDLCKHATCGHTLKSAVTAFCDMYRGFNELRVAFNGDGITEIGVIGLDVVMDDLINRQRRYQ